MAPYLDFQYLARQNTALALGFSEPGATADLVGQALANGRVLTAFQPVAAARNHRIAFFECLARIQKPSGEVIEAGMFMPAINDTDLVTRIDCAILAKACAVLAGDPVRRLSVNISPKTLGDPRWLAILEQAVAKNPACGDLLIVEITESSVLSLTPKSLEFLYRIRQLGCSIAIDDFGAGHSSLQHLGRFRFDFLKIDGTFIRDVSRNEDHQFLIKSMVSIAQHFEMVTVAEMVGSDADRARLADYGVDCVQGYGIGKPELFPDWLRQDEGARG